MGVSLLCREHEVRSELAYRRKMHAEGRQMTGMNLGMQTWTDTAEALRSIHRETARRGFRIDRYNMNADRRMGLPRRCGVRPLKRQGPCWRQLKTGAGSPRLSRSSLVSAT